MATCLQTVRLGQAEMTIEQQDSRSNLEVKAPHLAIPTYIRTIKEERRKWEMFNNFNRVSGNHPSTSDLFLSGLIC